MTTEQAWNRGNNLLAVSIVALSGFAFLPEFFFESEWLFKLDEILLFTVGVAAIWWYRSKNNSYTRSIVPVLLVLAGLAIKIMALILEFKDKADAGDDFGALTLFVLASILVITLYRRVLKS